MASFPEEGDYYVISSESIRTGKHAGEHVGATSLADDDHIVRGIAGEKTAVSWRSSRNTPASMLTPSPVVSEVRR